MLFRSGVRTQAPSYPVDINGADSSISLRATGDIVAPNFNNQSDVKLKENVESLTNGLDTIMGLNPVGFNWKSNGEKSYGLIAQEVEKIIPEIVKYEAVGDSKTVSYIQIISFLIAAVKELKAQIDKINNSAE